MSFFGLFKRSEPLPATAPVARHMLVKPEAVKVKIDRRAEVSILRIAVDIPA